MPRNAVQPLDKFFNVMSLVAIVGRPNVGKSTLFNRLVGQRQAIVDSTAGTTRDRHYGKTDWNGKEFSVIDTGGYTVNSDDIFEDDIRRQVMLAIGEADVIFCMDFNQINRLDRVTDTATANTTAQRVLIDHHLHPPVDGYTVQFSDTHSCSTSYIVYQLIEALAGTDAIDQAMAEALYVGIMTDTGNFSFSNLTADLFRAVAVLIDRGVNVPYVNSSVYDNFSEGRMRLLGYMLNDKMVTDYRYGVAYVSLTEEEMRRFNFIQGDSEGFVNYPLSIRGIRMSAMFIQTKHSIRVSLRSRGSDVDVNVFARRYFDGGGHRNAAGGKSYVSMDETLKNFHTYLKEYFGA